MTDAAARFQRLHKTLRQRICLLEYPPGTRLSEEALAAEFGTSRTPVRRVLARLEDEELVTTRHGVGTLVTGVDTREMAQVYELRMTLAQLCGQLSACEVTQDMLACIDALIARGDALLATPDPRAFAELNMEFHAFILTLTDNAALRDTAERLYFRTARIWLQAIPQLDLAQETAIFVDELRQTRSALQTGDPHAAALIHRAHISMSFQRLSKF